MLQPGALETKQRVFLETCAPMVRRVEADGVERWSYPPEETPYEQLFEPSRTYIYIKLTLSQPVTPTVPAEPEPLP